MPAAQFFLSHIEDDAAPAAEIRVLLETALPESRVVGRGDAVGESDLVLVLCGADSRKESTLHEDVAHAQRGNIPVIPIVHGGQTLDALSPSVSVDRGVEFHDQMFAIKLLLVIQEALGGEPLSPRGTAPRA